MSAPRSDAEVLRLEELFGGLGLPQDPPPRSEFHIMAVHLLSAEMVSDGPPALWERVEQRARQQLSKTAVGRGLTLDPASVIRHHAMAHAYTEEGPEDLGHSILGLPRPAADLDLRPDYFTVVWLARCVEGRP